MYKRLSPLTAVNSSSWQIHRVPSRITVNANQLILGACRILKLLVISITLLTDLKTLSIAK